MDALQLIARLLHIGLGIFWAGTIFFFVVLLEPAIRSLGPDGGKVMQALQKKNYLNILPIVALVTILSGFFLLWQSSGGFHPDWMGSSFGIALSTGGLTSVIAFVIGVFFMRPTALRIGKLGASLASVTEDDERNAIVAEMNALKSRTGSLGRLVAVFLLITVVTMAIARYL